MPADGAVAIGGDDQLAVRRDVDAPDGVGNRARLGPDFPATSVEQPERPVGTEYETVGARHQSHAAAELVLLQDERLAAPPGGDVVLPVCDRDAVGPGCYRGGQRPVLGRVDYDGPAGE